MISGVLLSFVLICFSVLVHLVIVRIFRPKRGFTVFLNIFVVFFGLYFLLFRFLRTSDIVGLINGPIFFVLAYCNYILCYYYVSQPVTLNMLQEFLKARGGKLTIGQLKENYSLTQMIDSRVKAMTLNGYVFNQKNHLQLTKKGKMFVFILRGLRKLFGVPYYLE